MKKPKMLQRKTLNMERREALKKLRNLSLASIAGSLSLSYMWNYRRDFVSQEDTWQSSAESPLAKSSLESTQATSIESTLSYPFSSNIPSEILSLPLQYFSIPSAISHILESHLTRHSNTHLIIPLIASKDFNHTQKALYHAYNVENINTHKIYNQTSSFLSYHYDTLKSLASDIESSGFVMRDFKDMLDSQELSLHIIDEILKLLIIDEMRSGKLDTTNLVEDKEFFNNDYKISLDSILKYVLDEKSALYKEYRRCEGKNKVSDKRSPIHCYNKALEILYDYKDYYFTNTRKLNAQGKVISTKEDKNKARELMLCLDRIGNNNIRALYVGINGNKKPNNDNNPPPHFAEKGDKKDNQDDKRPKFIGRLATTIIIEDGLWLG